MKEPRSIVGNKTYIDLVSDNGYSSQEDYVT